MENNKFFGNLVRNRKPYLDNRGKKEYECECLECGHVEKSANHCKDIKCPKCGGEMRRKNRPSKND